MKRLLPVCLCLTLLCGCAKKLPINDLPTTQESEVITYAVEPVLYEQKVTADDGTPLVSFNFQCPSLKVLVDGEPIAEAATTSQQTALEKADAFGEAFAFLTSEENINETIAMAEEQYGYTPELFQTTGMNYAEDFSFESHQMGNLISIAGMYYSYLGGAHPNVVYSSWNFDLERGELITLPELAEDPDPFIRDVADLMEVQANEWCHDPEYGGSPELTLGEYYWPDYRDVMERWPDSASVYFDASGLQIIFSAYDLASYAAGPQMFTIPYETLDPYWSEVGRTVLGLNT